MLYYYDHRDEINDEINTEWELVENERSSAVPSSILKRLRNEGLLQMPVPSTSMSTSLARSPTI